MKTDFSTEYIFLSYIVNAYFWYVNMEVKSSTNQLAVKHFWNKQHAWIWTLLFILCFVHKWIFCINTKRSHWQQAVWSTVGQFCISTPAHCSVLSGACSIGLVIESGAILNVAEARNWAHCTWPFRFISAAEMLRSCKTCISSVYTGSPHSCPI